MVKEGGGVTQGTDQTLNLFFLLILACYTPKPCTVNPSNGTVAVPPLP